MAKKPQIAEDRQVELLRVLVGSKAHGLDTPESDTDYRGVFAAPTEDLLKLWAPKTLKGWVEGEDVDSTSYELRHFLELAMTCNPSILEVFKAPVVDAHGEHFLLWQGGVPVDQKNGVLSMGNELRELFPCVWTAKKVALAFGGYAHNQQVKFLKLDQQRRWKFAVAYLRVLLQGIELLATGDFHVEVQRYCEGTETAKDWVWFLREVKAGAVASGAVLTVAERLNGQMDALAVSGPFKDHAQDEAPVNEFLLRVRGQLW